MNETAMQPAPSPEDFVSALTNGAALLGTSSPSNAANSMETVLKNRLQAYYDRLSENGSTEPDCLNSLSTLEDLQLQTAKEALSVLGRVQNLLNSEMALNHPAAEATPAQAPSIGTRDLAQLRTLLSLTCKWGLEPLFARVSQAWPPKPAKKEDGPQIIDLTINSEDCRLLSRTLLSLFSLVFPEGPEGRISQTLITTTILTHHISPLLLPAIALGWLPESLSIGSAPNLHEARPLVMRILRFLSPVQAIIALGGILSSTSPPPPLHVSKTCTILLTNQLLRPEGVQGLFEAMFSADETTGDEVEIEKLEHIARTLNTAPANVKPQEYYQLIFPRVFKFITREARPSYRRAAAFTIYRAVVLQKVGQHQAYACSIALEILHRPFLECLDSPEQMKSEKIILEPREALSSLTVLLSNTEPSPTFISKMLSPILPALYLFSYDLDQIKTADPSLKESVVGLLISWGKIVDHEEGSNILWSIIEGRKDNTWIFNLEGQFWRIKNSNGLSAPSLLLPAGLQQTVHTGDDFDADLNLFNLYPDPVHFVNVLKVFDRGDIASTLFLRLLENYRDMKDHLGEDSIRILHKLQIIMQMQNRLSEGTASNILRKPDQLLSFIFHVFDSASVRIQDGNTSANNASNQIPSVDEYKFEEMDSDDEAPDSEVIGPDDELIETAITLLLSILEVDETLSARTHPIFNDIFSKLETLALKGSSTLRPLAREARLVITARLAHASGASGAKQKKNGGEDTQETYQKALKLLQDPILPVRAHGLLLLRQLLSPPFTKDHQLNEGLVPSILSIFLQSVQDEDSYMFLNAVQGLADLVDSYGKQILQGLINDYAGGLEGLGVGNLTQQDIDVRTRIGEALNSVIKRCGDTLGLYVDILVPRLFAVVRGSNIPTTLRTSALSLLAGCVDIYPWAMLPYVEDLCQAMVDLLQIESLALREREPQPRSSTGKIEEIKPDEENPPPETAPLTMNSDPRSRNSKFPPLRRAALHFLSLLIRASTKIVYEESGKVSPKLFSSAIFQRMSLTLGYVSSTDEDDVVRVMAREAKESLEQLQRAALGL